MIRPYDYLRATLDPVRLAVLGHAAVGPVNPQTLAKEIGVPERRVLQAAGRLREAGLLDDELRLRPGALRELAEMLTEEQADPDVRREADWSSSERAVLGRFLRGRTLTQIPAQRTKRMVILERLAQEFEPGMRYEEWQVNLVLKEFHADVASLRRFLVDEGLLTRERGVYWRTGGRVT